MIANVTVELVLDPAERFDFHQQARRPDRAPVKIQVHKAEFLTSTDLPDGVRLSGTRYRASGEPGTRPWTLGATLEQLPPHVLDGLREAQTIYAARAEASS